MSIITHYSSIRYSYTYFILAFNSTSSHIESVTNNTIGNRIRKRRSDLEGLVMRVCSKGRNFAPFEFSNAVRVLRNASFCWLRFPKTENTHF